jgi:hypothetical protein
MKYKRENVCKSCREICTCGDCVGDAIFHTFDSQINLLLMLVKDNMELPNSLIEKIKYLADLISEKKV